MKIDSKSQEFSWPGELEAKILLVDDDADMREYGGHLLKSFGYQFLEAPNAEAALKILMTEKPDLILADVMMPGIDGLEFLRIIRAKAETREIPVIMLSARYGEAARIEGLDAGADDYIEKPFSANELSARIKAHLKMARVRSQAAERERRLRRAAELATEALRESESRVRIAVEAAGLATWDWNLDTDEIIWNERHFTLFGLEPRSGPVSSAFFFDFVHEDDKDLVEERLREAIAENKVFEAEFRVRLESGKIRWIEGYGQTVEFSVTRKPHRICGVMSDVTRRKKAEKAVHDREILQRIVGAQELERRRISRDLHDDLGQLFTALRIKLEQVRGICRDQAVCDEIDKIQTLARQIDEGIDFLAWEMRPAVLDDLGLLAALEKFAAEWARHTGIPAEILPSNLKGTRLFPETEINLYRIVQEALNNVSKHARAGFVELSLNRRDNWVILIIADDGQGFDPQIRETMAKGIGLSGMNERAALVGGTLDIESSPGSGTTVFVRIPLKSVPE